MKKGLILSGGGSRGMAHIGALKVFDSLGIEFDAIAGCSIGALIGAFYASGKTGQEIEDFILKESIYKSFDLSFSPLGIKTLSKLEKKFGDFIGVKTFNGLKTPLYINATNLTKGKEVVFEKGNLMSAIRASTAVPGLFHPIKIKKDYYVDGGIINQLPFSSFPKEIKKFIIVDVSSYDGLNKKNKINLFDVLNSSIRLMQTQISLEKMSHLKKRRYIKIVPPVTKLNLVESEKKYNEIIKLGQKETLKHRSELIYF